MASMDALWSHVGISGTQVGGVVLAATVLYVVYAVVLRVWGQRIRASTSTFSLVLVTVLGSIVARAMLGDAPTLLGGLTAIATLVVLEGVFGVLRRRFPIAHLRRSDAPVVLVAGGEVREDALRWARLSRPDLATRLRQEGVTSLADLALVVLEPRGELTIVRGGQTIDEELVWDVDGASDLPDSVVSRRRSG